MPPPIQKYCRRAHTFTPISLYEATIASIAACGKSVSALLFRISSGSSALAPLPHFRLSYVKPGKEETTRVFNHIAYDRIIEYKDTDSELGFQPAKDIVLTTHWLGLGFGPNGPNFKWSPLVHSTMAIPDGSGDLIRRISFNLRKIFQPRFLADIQFGVDISPKEITVNGTMKQILTPNSFKITVDINNITFANSSASGFALGGIVVTAASIRARANTTIARDGDRPDDQLLLKMRLVFLILLITLKMLPLLDGPDLSFPNGLMDQPNLQASSLQVSLKLLQVTVVLI